MTDLKWKMLLCNLTGLNVWHEPSTRCCLVQHLPSNHGAYDSVTPSLADLRMDSGSGMEWRTIAPYRPYSAITLLRPQHFSLFLHLALRFWNHTCEDGSQGWKSRSLPSTLFTMRQWGWKNRCEISSFLLRISCVCLHYSHLGSSGV